MPRQAREEKPKHLSVPQQFVEKSRALQVYELAVQNYSVQQIADKLGVTEERVRQVIAEEQRRITVAMQELKERYQTVTMARTEFWYLKLSEIILAQIEAEPLHGPSKDLFRMMMDVVKFQKEIAMPKDEKPAEDNSKNLTINQTFVAGDPFYDRALQEMQTDFLGYTVHKTDPAITTNVDVQPDKRILEIESLASKYLPEGIPPDDDSDTD